MKYTKVLARKYLFPQLYEWGFDKWVRGLSYNNHTNLMYHGVTKNNTNFFSRRNIDIDQFEKQIKYIKHNFDVISCNDSFNFKKDNKRDIKKTVTISFDDGLMNNLTNVLPIVEHYSIPITVFVSGICGVEGNNEILWAEKLDALKYFEPKAIIKYNQFRFVNFIEENKGFSISQYIKDLPYNERDCFLNFLDREFSITSKIRSLDEEIWRLLNKKELIELSKSQYVSIGSHGQNHFNLGNLGKEDLTKELLSSKTILEKCINKKVDSIAFPDGSYSKLVLDTALECGYDYMFCVKLNMKKDARYSYLKHRYGVSTTTTFESNIFGINLSFVNGIKF
ncbi:MAG: polysaccharide deacetylase family protein [Saprospiraceae bacterium]